MRNIFFDRIEQYRTVMAGLVAVFLVHVFLELLPTIYVGIAVAAIALGILMAYLTSRHFGHSHHHVGDSAIDVIPVAVLIFANIAHPAIDGFTAVETFRIGGVIAGMLFAGSIILHEIVRQSFLSTALTVVNVGWIWVVGTACIGITTGIVAGFFGADFLHRYEFVADIATLFSYSFVIAEFYFIGTKHANKKDTVLFVGGILLGVGMMLITSAH